uniref:nucleoside diphosphate phosphatase n=1 Tax=Clastoptera arizonana TaxID=38151 RepID=A0A1B6DXP7_9HEMI
MAVTRRKIQLDQNNGSRSGSPSSTRRSKPSGPSKTQKQCLIYSVIIIALTIFFTYTILSYGGSHKTGTLDSIALALGLHKNIYVVIIDAGSTGSRVLALSFHQSVIDSSLKLEGELFVSVEPGLSSFADQPKQGAEKIKELLEKAKEFVPKSAWSATPLALRATAGLRLLPPEQADSLINEVKKVFAASPFHTTASSVAIMDGADEGLFSWVNVNFLSDKLFGSPDKTMAALDLGGGSTQITFALEDARRLKKASPDDVHTLNLFKQSVPVYTHSYLGLGIMAARKAILSKGNPPNATDLKSECINPIIKGKVFKYGGVSYTVQGPDNPEIIQKRIKGSELAYERIPVVRIKECSAIITDYIRDQNVLKPTELLDYDISAFSYFYDRAIEVGLIDPFIGGSVTVQQFHTSAETVCYNPNVEQPFMCLDLMFITILLEDGYGLKPETKLKMLKSIDGHEVSWSLGMALNIIQNGL